MNAKACLLLALITSLVLGGIGCGGGGGGGGAPLGPAPTLAALANARPVFSQATPLTARANTWLSGVPAATHVNGTEFDAGVAELFYTTALGVGSPIGGGALTAEPPPGGALRTVTVPTDIDGWSPVGTGLAANTPTTLRVTNPDGQFVEMAGLTWSRTGALSNVNVSARAGHDADISVAVNPAAPAVGLAAGSNAVMVWATGYTGAGSTAIYASTTTDFGLTWSAPQDVGPLDGLPAASERSQPHCAFDRFGNLEAWWLTRDTVGGFDRLGTTRSADGGVTFASGGFLGVYGPPASTTMHLSNLSTGINNGTFAPGGSVFIIATLGAGTVNLFSMEYSALGSAFQAGAAAAAPINDAPPAGTGLADVGTAVGPGGEFVVTWTDVFIPPGNTTNIYQDIDPDGLGAGSNFGVDSPVASPSYPPDAMPIASQGYFPGVGCRPVPVVLPVGPNAGRIVVAYQGVNEATFAGPPGDHEVFTIFSDDGGLTWSVPLTVHPANANDQTYPWIDADPLTGTLYVTWFSTVNDAGNVRNQRFSAASADGAAWSAPLLLSQGTSDASLLGSGTSAYSKYSSHSAFGGLVYAGWADNSNLVLAPPFPSVAPNPDGNLIMDAYATVYMQRP